MVGHGWDCTRLPDWNWRMPCESFCGSQDVVSSAPEIQTRPISPGPLVSLSIYNTMHELCVLRWPVLAHACAS